MSGSRTLRTVRDLPVRDKRVLVRADFNVGMENGAIRSDVRIRACMPTISWLREQNCQIVMCSHLGRPAEGQFDESCSLAPVAQRLEELAGFPVRLVRDWLNSAPEVSSEYITLLENVRFLKGEKANDETLARAYAGLCDVFVLDAFGSAHRAHASTLGVAQHAPVAAAGLLVESEVNALRKSLDDPARPVVAIIGGSKTSTKLPVLRSIIGKVDFLIPGGGIANNFIACAGDEVGRSLWEPDLLEETKNLLDKSCEVLTPRDVLVAESIDKDARHRYCKTDEVGDGMIVDIGPGTIEHYCEKLDQARTIIWNGPVGVFEIDAFARGTEAIAEAIARQTRRGQAFSIAGGGDTLDAIERFAITDISYTSTGGGAFLEFMENLTLVALEPLFI